MDMAMTDENLRVERRSNGVCKITLNRPERLNALTRDLMLALGGALVDAAADEEVRVISLHGEGRAFCAGQDLAERDPRKLSGPLNLAEIQRELFHPVICSIAHAPKPVVACVNGVAAGAGAGIALAADIVIAAESASFAFSFAKVGLSVDAGLGRALVQGFGAPRARALLMLGETLSAGEAAAAGLIHSAVADKDLPEAHGRLLESLAAAPRQALIGIKQAIAATHLPVDEYLKAEALLQGRAGTHPDYAEGVLSFFERRPARFN